MFGILGIATLTLSALVAGAAWAGQRAETRFGMEVENRKRAEWQARAVGRARRELLANVRHQLHNSLDRVIGTADQLLAADLPAAERHQVEVLGKAAEVFLALADELFDFSKTVEKAPSSWKTLPPP